MLAGPRGGRSVRRYAPGLALAAVVGATAHAAAALAFPGSLAAGLEVPLAMLLGLAVAARGVVGDAALPGIRVAVRYVLGAGIILLGLRLNLQTIVAIGSGALLLVFVVIGAVVAFAVHAGRRLGVDRRVAVLIGVGTAICGNSAILAAAPVVRAGDREVSFAVATITISGTLGVLVLPALGHLLGLDALTFGLWAGAAVPDTAQTIGASAAYSTVGRDVATVVKLVRTVMLAPVLLLLAWVWCRSGGGSTAARTAARKAFPFFLVGFVLMVLLRTARVLDPEALAGVDVVTRACFLVALAALGLQTRFDEIRAVGRRPFALGLATAGLSALGSLALIVALGLGPARTAVAGSVDPRPLGGWTTLCTGGPPSACAAPAAGPAPQSRVAPVQLTARVIASGIPAAGALSPVGRFHAGGPLHDKRSFAARTRPGAVLDPTRLLVASTSNLGAPLARADLAPGSIVSLATGSGSPIRVAPDLGRRPRRGPAQLYTAQSPAFLNAVHNPGADTARLPAVSNPLGISINNAFGRPWIANAPGRGGNESVLDPDGAPLAHAPSDDAGGVFADLRAGAIANALIGASPDVSGRAVFAVATADGALVQVHVEKGVAPLAPAGTLAPLPAGASRAGMVFNWVPDRFLYVSDPGRDAVMQLRLDDDFRRFRVVGSRRLLSPDLSVPIDLAPAVPESANPAFSSNTTLAGGADVYVANRGSGTVARLGQDGRIRALARVRIAGRGLVGPGELNGIAVSPDTHRVWLSLRDEVVEMPAFGAPG